MIASLYQEVGCRRGILWILRKINSLLKANVYCVATWIICVTWFNFDCYYVDIWKDNKRYGVLTDLNYVKHAQAKTNYCSSFRVEFNIGALETERPSDLGCKKVNNMKCAETWNRGKFNYIFCFKINLKWLMRKKHKPIWRKRFHLKSKCALWDCMSGPLIPIFTPTGHVKITR